MKIVKKGEIARFEHGQTCTAIEYPLADPDINVAIIELQGRYPQTGRALNEISKELAYIASGKGKISVEDKETEVSEGDLVMVLPGEKFYWEGEMTIFMPCVPAWTPQQYKIVE